MAYQPHAHDPAPVDPDRGSATGYAAIKYRAIVIVVLAGIVKSFGTERRDGHAASS